MAQMHKTQMQNPEITDYHHVELGPNRSMRTSITVRDTELALELQILFTPNQIEEIIKSSALKHAWVVEGVHTAMKIARDHDQEESLRIKALDTVANLIQSLK